MLNSSAVLYSEETVIVSDVPSPFKNKNVEKESLFFPSSPIPSNATRSTVTLFPNGSAIRTLVIRNEVGQRITVSPQRDPHTVSFGGLLKKVVKEAFSEERVEQNLGSSLGSVVKAITHSTTLACANTTEEETMPVVSDPRDLIPYYRRRYTRFRKVSLALTREWRMYHIRMHNYELKTKKGYNAVKPVTPKPTPPGPPIQEKEDFNGMDPPNGSFVIPVHPWKEGEVVHLRYFRGNKEVNESDVMYDGIDNPSTYSFALVGVTTYSRIFFISHFLQRWKG